MNNLNGRSMPVFSSSQPSWFINAKRDKVVEILKKSSQMNNGNCCIRPGSKPNTYAITSYIDGEVKNFSIIEDKNRYKLVLQEKQPWVPSLQDILLYFVSVSKGAVPVRCIRRELPPPPTENSGKCYYNTDNSQGYVNIPGEGPFHGKDNKGFYYNLEKDDIVMPEKEPHYLPMDGGIKRFSDCSNNYTLPCQSRQSVPENFIYVNTE